MIQTKEDNCLQETPPAPEHMASPDNCENRSTLSNLDTSSMTAEDSKDICGQTADAIMDKGTGWTDEKHNLYLNSLETSFVKQLQRSTGLLAWCSDTSKRRRNSNSDRTGDSVNVSEQFTVLRDGHWQKISYRRNLPNVNKAAHSNDIFGNPWVHHFTEAGKNCGNASVDPEGQHEPLVEGKSLTRKSDSCFGLTASRQHFPLNHQSHGSVGTISEGSGQNFPDENHEGLSRVKRLKKNLTNNLDQDQIVPSGSCHVAESSSSVNSSSTSEDAMEDFLPETA